MKILGIETSCDETGAAIVQDGTKILSNVVDSSQELHIKTGGIIPERAAREQVKSIIPVIEEALIQSSVFSSQFSFKGQPVSQLTGQPKTENRIPDIDAIAVTVGPGLIGSLLVGVETAKTLAYLWNKPLIPVNHLLAHVYANWLIPERSENSDNQKIRMSDDLKVRNSDTPSFPNITLIVSGGHTELLLMKDHGNYEWLGGTRDDAAGEAFDKIARLLNLGYPGGPAIAAAATKHLTHNTKYSIRLPRPMIDSDDFDFSFSGLKTAVIREISNLSHSTNWTYSLAYEVQEAITDVLVKKTVRAAREKDVKNICLAGGVAANSRLREKLLWELGALKLEVNLFVPPPSLCTDNAAAIASCAYFNNSPLPWQKVQTNPSLSL